MHIQLHQKFKPNWPLALIHQARVAIKMILSASTHLKPFTLRLPVLSFVEGSKRRARLRQAQPERVSHGHTYRLRKANYTGVAT